jgi:hypothetical protein
MASIDTSANALTIIADDQLQARLAPLTQVTEIRTADGGLMGTFTPASALQAATELDELYRHAMTLFDPEEIKRRAESDEPCYTFEEVMAYLNSLESK